MSQFRLVREDYTFEQGNTAIHLEVLHERSVTGRFGRIWTFLKRGGRSITMKPCSAEQVQEYEAEFARLLAPKTPGSTDVSADLEAALALVEKVMVAVNDTEHPTYVRAGKAREWLRKSLYGTTA